MCVSLPSAFLVTARGWKREESINGCFNCLDPVVIELAEAVGVPLRLDGSCVTGVVENDAAQKDVQARLEEEVRWYLTAKCRSQNTYHVLIPAPSVVLFTTTRTMPISLRRVPKCWCIYSPARTLYISPPKNRLSSVD